MPERGERKNEAHIAQAIPTDLGKSALKSYMCKTGLAASEISYMLSHTRRFDRKKTVRTLLTQFVSRSFVKLSPYSVALIMSPWNYPFLLNMDPLLDAISAVNTVVLRSGACSFHTNRMSAEILSAVFPPAYVAVI